MTPEEQAIHASIAEKLKPVFENKEPLKINDLSTKTHENTGNKPAKPESTPQPLSPKNQPQATTTTFAGNTPLPENETPLITNDLHTKTHENNLSVAIAFSEGYGNEPFSSHSSVAKATENLETMLEGLRKAFLQNHSIHPNNEIDPNTTSNTAPLPENEKPLIINDLHPKTPETTGNEPFSSHSSVAKATENLETLLEGLRKAFLQYHPLQPDNVFDPNTTSNTAPLPENEIPLIINDLDTKTPENTGNKPATQETPKQPNYNLIRQGEVFSRPVYITPSWPFREEPRGNKYKY
jgi:hypothetical protein